MRKMMKQFSDPAAMAKMQKMMKGGMPGGAGMR
jgi:signal recognition particle subunit SRP54